MNRKGFTLVELLAIIVIITLLTVLAVPNIVSITSNINVKVFCEKIDTIEQAAITYANDNYLDSRQKVSEENKIIIREEVPLSVLVDYGYLTRDNDECSMDVGDCITDPRDSTQFLDKRTFMIYTKNNRLYVQFNYTQDEKSYNLCK